MNKKQSHKNISKDANDNSELRTTWNEAYELELSKLVWLERFVAAALVAGILLIFYGAQQYAIPAFTVAAICFYRALSIFIDCSNINYLLHRLDIDDQREGFAKFQG